MQSQALIANEKEYLKKAYETEKQLLECNIKNLFLKYRSKLSDKNGDALVNVRKTGHDMISDIDFVCFPWRIIGSSLTDSEENDNYRYVITIYQSANNLINLLLANKLDNTAITEAKNTLTNNINAFLPKNETLDCCGHSISAFYNSLIILAAVIALCLVPFAPIGIGIGLIAAGFFAGTLGVARLVHNVKVLNESARKTSLEFAHNAEEVTEAIIKLPTPTV